MTVRELIAKLEQFPPDAVVKLADWNEDYLIPSAEALDSVRLEDGCVILG